MNEKQMKCVADLIINLEKTENKYNQLQSNWNSLRKYIQEEIITSKNIGDQHWFYYQIVLDKMNELEGKDKN